MVSWQQLVAARRWAAAGVSSSLLFQVIAATCCQPAGVGWMDPYIIIVTNTSHSINLLPASWCRMEGPGQLGRGYLNNPAWLLGGVGLQPSCMSNGQLDLHKLHVMDDVIGDVADREPPLTKNDD